MTIGILQCGDPPAHLAAEYGPYGDMVRGLLGPDRRTATYDMTKGVLPGQHGAYVLTGSPAGVYDDLPWIPGLLGFLRQVRGRAKLVGICFGHQAMAQAFGGTVTKAPAGWGIGLHRYDVEHRAPWMDGADHIHMPASHQDQVIVRPPEARVTVSSAFAPYAGLDYGHAISFQFHPEFTAAFGTALIDLRRDLYGALADPAIASYQRPNDCSRVAGWIGRFLDQAPS